MLATQSWYFSFETDNGISRSESGEINEEVLSVSGSYRYSEDGKTYIVTYTADKNGYRPMFRIDEASPPSVGIGSAVLASLAGGGLG